MLRRFKGFLTLMTAALAIAGSAHGASIVTENGTKYAYYELVNTRPTPVSDLVLAGVVPPTSVVAGPFWAGRLLASKTTLRRSPKTLTV